ncbi:MAG: radical SAM protein [Candidatus Omnitrophota bacterium]
MKILLVNPNFKGVVSVPSLGLGFIAAHLRKHLVCDVEVVEPLLQGLSERAVLEKAKKAEKIGLVCYTESRFQCFDFAEKIKRFNSATQIFVGGPHVNALDSRILQYYPCVDMLVRNEGEETVLDIAKAKPLEQILGLTWRNKNGAIIRNGDRPLLENIDGFEYDYSFAYPFLKDWKDIEIPRYLQKRNAIPIIGSRGCPFQCVFCAAHEQWGRKYRGVSPEILVHWVENLVECYNIGYFRFYDALFIGTDERILRFCDLLEQSNLRISFRVDIRVGTKKETLRRLKQVGCDVVGFGVESGSDRILKRVNKRITKKEIIETIKDCRELGFWVLGFFMVSLPDETMEDVRETFALLKSFDEMNLQFFKIHPNTEFYDELKRKGEIDDSIWFDENRGLTTRYGNEIYYCKENFPSARFSLRQGNYLLRYAYHKFKIENLRAVIRLRGVMSAMPIIAKSVLGSLVARCGELENL